MQKINELIRANAGMLIPQKWVANRCLCILFEGFYSRDQRCNSCTDELQMRQFALEPKKYFETRSSVSFTKDNSKVYVQDPTVDIVLPQMRKRSEVFK